MFDVILDYLKNLIKSRILPLTLVYLALFVMLIHRLFEIQIVRDESVIAETEDILTKEREIKATRGNIYDCNGVLLAFNELSYTVTLEDIGAFGGNEDKNAMIHRLVQIIEKNGGEIATEFYIQLNEEGELEFTVSGNAEMRFKKNAYARKSIDALTEEERRATAEEVYEFLRTGTYMFGISDDYTVEETLKIMNIRYAMFMNTYNKYLPISIAVDVNDRTVAAIMENSPDLPGVEILQETHRVYNDSEYFAHILGYTGMVNESEMESDNNNYYSATDQIGKTGLERVFEEKLRGEKGKEIVSLNSSYRVTDVLETVEPTAGNDLYLTIDSELQKAGYWILEQNLAGILLSRIQNSATAGNTAETTASNLNIPIYDVYYALINNNIININHFSAEDATPLEQKVYQLYLEEESDILERLGILLEADSTITESEASSELRDYLGYIYTWMGNSGLLMKSVLDTEDDQYKRYRDDKLSLSQFLQYAISMNWIDLEMLDIGEEYYDTEELYRILLDRVFHDIREDGTFRKMIYSTLVYSYVLTGKDLCLLLYDQEILRYDDPERVRLENGNITAYQFIRSKIESLEITPAMLALDPCSGSLVITDPNTGQVRAMVSYPSYDNNKLANRIDSAYYSQLMKDQSLPTINRPLLQKTAPGSTFKMLTAITGLEEGVVDLYETIYDGVVYDKVGIPATCWSNRSHGDINIREAIEVSCNYYFYEVGYRLSLDNQGNYNTSLGLTKLTEYADRLGIGAGDTTGIELNEYEPDITDIDAIRSSIGQGSWGYTPSQIARYTATLANGGLIHNLTLVDHIEDVKGRYLENTISSAVGSEPEKVDLKDSTWDAVHDGMYAVINSEDSSYRKLFQNLEVIVAGKTGTAQIVSTRGNHALFTSYAPFEDPELTLTVVLPYAYTSTNAAKVAADFYEYYYGTRDLQEVMDGGVNAEDEAYNTRVTN